MNSLEISKLLIHHQTTRPYFLGCFPADKIPISRIIPHCMIVNTDNSQGIGQHWTAIYVIDQNHAEYYDSFGVWPPVMAIGKYLSRYKFVTHNRSPLQSEYSLSCGRHAMYFLIRRCGGSGFVEIMQHLRKCKTIPDRLVSASVNRYFDTI